MSAPRAKQLRREAARPAAHAGVHAAVLVDTGILVALHDRSDRHHAGAVAWLSGCDAALHTVDAVLTEASFFLPVRLRAQLALLAARGVLRVHTPDAAAYTRVAKLFDQYRDQDPDWADLQLVWLAETLGTPRIATVDVADFAVYRLHGRRRFELELLR